MINIKISTPFPEWPLLRQTPRSSGVWKNSQFHVDDDRIIECDFFVVYEGIKNQVTVSCPKGNKILITGEPPCIKQYKKKFLDQFDTIITCQTKIKGTNVIHNQQGLPWHIGRKYIDGIEKGFVSNYDTFRQKKCYNKNKLISIISSDKTGCSGHKRRLKFVNLLKDHFGDCIDIFGRGINEIEDKAEAIEPYKYHIAIENCACDDYFSEKLTDTYLGGAFPIYFGCTNLNKYFPTDSYEYIDIKQPLNAITTIENLLSSNKYKDSEKILQYAKHLTLEKYNVFPMIYDIINNNLSSTSDNKESLTIYPEISRLEFSKIIPFSVKNIW